MIRNSVTMIAVAVLTLVGWAGAQDIGKKAAAAAKPYTKRFIICSSEPVIRPN